MNPRNIFEMLINHDKSEWTSSHPTEKPQTSVYVAFVLADRCQERIGEEQGKKGQGIKDRKTRRSPFSLSLFFSSSLPL